MNLNLNMLSSILFIIVTAIAVWFVSKSVKKIARNIHMGRPESLNDNKKLRLKTMIRVAFGQSKMTKKPIPAFLHLIIYVGFILINIEVLEIIIDGITGNHRIFQPLLGGFYGFLIGFFEILGVLVILACIAFLYRRHVSKVKRFTGVEMNGWPIKDANYILFIEIVLMSALLLMNAADAPLQNAYQLPISQFLTPIFSSMGEHALHTTVKLFWWIHWIGVLLFVNYIPFSKHLHIFLAFPNTYYSKLEPVGEIPNMASVTTEVKLMLDPSFTPPDNYQSPEGFGAKDVADLSWKNLMESYSCTECGRCTSVCPANITGKLLSPRKVMMDTRDRLVELGNEKDKNGPDFHDGKSLHDKISSEELWACTTCNACVDACPINIRPVDIIMQMRQYLVMEQSAAPSELNGMLTNLENNSAPWQFSPSDRANWTNQ